MLLKKVTIGFVTQTFDTDKGVFVSQEFTCGDDVTYENEFGNPVNPAAFEVKSKEAYLSYLMVQPSDPNQVEQAQNDIECIMDGADEDQIASVCQVIVDRFGKK